MAQYHLFAGQNHYPGGGMKDYKGTFDTVEQAKAAFETFRQTRPRAFDLWANIAYLAAGELTVIEEYEDYDLNPGKEWNE